MKKRETGGQLLVSFRKTSSPVAYCVLSTGMGTRDENPEYNGLAHLTEHMLFKGTSRRSSVRINGTLEKVGGDLNAYTTKERIVVFSTTLREDVSKAVELIFEVVFDSQFPAEELKKEKSVVYDEIITYQDSPTELLYDTFEAELLSGTPLGYSILGDKKTLEPVTTEVLKENLAKFFIPSNMSLMIAGNFEEEQIVRLVDRELRRWRPDARIRFVSPDSASSDPDDVPMTSREYLRAEYDSRAELAKGNLFEKQVDKQLRQAHCIVGCCAYSYYNTRRKAALSLLTNILGGPALNSRLSLSLREKHALVYNVEASYISYKDCGVFSIYFGCDKQYLDKCLSLIKSELAKFAAEPMTSRALGAAKKQMIGQLSIASDNVESQCLTMGKSMLLTGHGVTFDTLRSDIESLTPEDLLSTAREVLDWSRMSRLVFV